MLGARERKGEAYRWYGEALSEASNNADAYFSTSSTSGGRRKGP